MWQTLLAALIFGFSLGVTAKRVMLMSRGLSLQLDVESGAFDIFVDGAKWIARDTSATAGIIPLANGDNLGPPKFHQQINGTDRWGPFTSIELAWSFPANPNAVVLITSVRSYTARELMILEQTWPAGLTQNVSGSDARTIAPYPTLLTSSAENTTVPLNYYQWGGCQIANSFGGRWTDASTVPGGQRLGVPLLLYNSTGRSLVFSPAMNWLVAVHEEQDARVGVGIKASVKHLPPGFKHGTALVGGGTINQTMYNLGDTLLGQTQKTRVNPDDDFVLSHLGYWTDNGAFYDSSNNVTNFKNHEDMLVAMKKQWQAQNIPFRYVQWDDWQWVSGSHHPDIPGPYPNWMPLPRNIPSGMTDWLGMPTSLYTPMYAANTSYITQNPELGHWSIDHGSAKGGSALPLDASYYRAAFRNGSRARMKMFEQDFLCTYQWSTNLTTSDVATGMQWLRAMDEAASSFIDHRGQPASTTIQLCMMTPLHALASTELMQVTNGRGTSDNLHDSRPDLYKLGPSGLLLGAMGLWSSRDNVFTSAIEPGCHVRNCTSRDYRLQNVAAVLAGGPYGPSDGMEYLNADMILRSCRADGVLLKPDRPLAMTDAELLKKFPDTFAGREGGWSGHVWTTGTDRVVNGRASGDVASYSLRWGYVLSIDTNADMFMMLAEVGGSAHATNYFLWDYWATDGNFPPRHATPVRHGGGFFVPQSAKAPVSATPSSTGTYQVLSPVLTRGWCVLGEIDKVVTVSRRRFRQLHEQGTGLDATVVVSSNETVVVWLITPNATKGIFSLFTSMSGRVGRVAISPISVTCKGPVCAYEDCETAMSLSCDNGRCVCL